MVMLLLLSGKEIIIYLGLIIRLAYQIRFFMAIVSDNFLFLQPVKN